jgi:FMN phosphatase YigB (HAD superfamily)
MVNKPKQAAYTRALAMAGETDPRACVLADDLPRNLVPAAGMGMTTVLVGPAQQDGAADYRIERITDLTRALPGLVTHEDR